MAIGVAEIFKRASIILQDEEFVRWTKAELFLWLNDGACEIVLRRPAARAVTGAVTLAAGSFQKLPEGAIELLDVIRNVKSGAPGRAIRRIDRQLLDDQVPTWPEMKPSDTIKHFMFDEATPTTFYVYPPAKAGTTVDVMQSEAPPEVARDTDVVLLDRAYLGPIVSYMLYRALAKDTDTSNVQMSTAHFQAFSEAIGSQNGITEAASPNTRVV